MDQQKYLLEWKSVNIVLVSDALVSVVFLSYRLLMC